MTNEELQEQLRTLQSELDDTITAKRDAESRLKEAEEKAKSQEWLAQQLGTFVRDMSCGLYEGKEKAAAQRVYDLNKSSIRKRYLNAYKFDSLEEAKQGYIDATQKEADAEEVLKWLFKTV